MKYEDKKVFYDMKKDLGLLTKVFEYKWEKLKNVTNNFSVFYCELNIQESGEIESLEYAITPESDPVFIRGQELIDLIEEVKKF